MVSLMWLIVIGSSIWMGVDASKLGYDQRDVRGLAAMSPAGWFFSGLLLWIVGFPLYLLKRPELKAAGDARRLRMQHAMAALPGAGYGRVPPAYGPQAYGAYGATPGHPAPGQAPAYGQPQAGYAPHAPAPGHAQGHAHGHAHGHVQGHAQGHTHGHAHGHTHGHAQPNAYGQPQGYPPAQPAPASNAGQLDFADEIIKLAAMRDQGLLTDAEFQQKKSQLLNRT
ncbi:MAG: SHOCT domain-containing protein [Myxococcota bacterium]